MQPGPLAFQAWGVVDAMAPFAANLMLHSTVLVTAGLMLSWMFRVHGAALQSLIVRAFLAAVLLSPIFTVIIQSAGVHGIMLDIPRVAPADPVKEFDASFAGVEQEKTTLSLTLPSAPILSAQPVAGQDRTFHISLFQGLVSRRAFFTTVLFVWLILSGVYLFHFLLSYGMVLYLRYYAKDASWEDIRTCRQVAYELEVDAPIVLKSSLTGSPFITGIIKPALILPADVQVSREVMYHEIAHLARRDCLWNIISMLGIILVPLQPLMHLVARRVEQLSDYVCDDYVLECRGNRKAYAYQLLDLAERCHRLFQPAMAGAGAVKSKSELRHRIERLLRQQRVRIANGCRAILMVIGVALVLGFIVGSVYFNNRPHRVLTAFFSVMSFEIVTHPEQPEFDPPMDDEAEPAAESTPVLEALAITEPEPEQSEIEEVHTGKIITASPENLFPAAPVVEEDVDDNADRMSAIRELLEKQSQPLTIESAMERLGLTEEDLSTYDACVRTGIKMIETRRYCLAEKIFEKALVDFDMNDPQVTNLMGVVYLGKGELDLARYYVKKAIILDPTRAEYHTNLGHVYWAMGKRVEAMNMFGQAIEMNPKYANAKSRRQY